MTRQLPGGGPACGRPVWRYAADCRAAGTRRQIPGQRMPGGRDGSQRSGPRDRAGGDGVAPRREGQLPFSLRIGVTGHRELADPDALLPAVTGRYPGAHRAVPGPRRRPAAAGHLRAGRGGRPPGGDGGAGRAGRHAGGLLPLPPASTWVTSPATPRKPSSTTCSGGPPRSGWPRRGSSRDEAYERAGRHVVDRADVLIALWDGQPPRGRGGTASDRVLRP